MNYGICLIATAALRMHPDHKSEMVSQLLFGETFFIHESITNWHHVECSHDHYRGWIAKNQATTIDEDRFENLERSAKCYAGDRLGSIHDSNNKTGFLISGGSTLIYTHDKMILGNKQLTYTGNIITPESVSIRDVPVFARKFLHTPYLWGGRSSFGLDCSGLVQVVFRMAGISLPRDASIQANQGEPVHLLEESVPGDLVFFDDTEEMINHVGILLGEGLVIHAHGIVRIDKIDHHGIFNTETGKYSHPLRLIKRIHK